jgi:hypothetical protein
MSWLNEARRQIRQRIGSLSRTGRSVAVCLAVLVVAGAAWLALGGDSQAFTPVTDEPLNTQDTAAAIATLETGGIACKTRGGVVLVPAGRLGEARDLLNATRSTDETAAFQRVAAEQDIWQTHAQSEKRWQAAKMASLSRLIAEIPEVDSATVIFEPGQPRRIGSTGQDPTAAVKVRLVAGKAMTYRLAAAVADLISGSIAGMTRESVRVVDNTGRSFRIREQTAAEAEALARREMAEAYYASKVAAALAHVENASVCVQIVPGSAPERRIATVSIPRRYLGDRRVDEVTAGVHRTVAGVIGAQGAEDVRVEWYTDAAPAPAPATWLHQARTNPLLAATVLGALGFVALAGAVWWSRRRRRAPAAAGDRNALRQRSQFFAHLAGAESEQVLGLIRDEHPQTIALVLAHLGSAKAAAVLAGLAPDTQVEVTRRLAGVDEMAPDVADEVADALAVRLAETSDAGDEHINGIETIARILNHAGYATEKTVLEGLADDEPTLAESIRRRVFVFEDIADLPAPRLREALAPLGDDELVLALRTAGEALTKKVLSALPSATAKKVRREMDRIGPVRLMDVEAAQQRVVDAMRAAAAPRRLARDIPA